jgi:hypothetical protein
MDGWNREFRKDVSALLKKCALHVEDSILGAPGMSNPKPIRHATIIAEFDIQPHPSMAGNLRLTQHPHPTASHSHPRRGYWLHYSAGQDFSTDINNNADYLFTPQMSGCYFGVNASATRVCHIAGMHPRKLGRDKPEKMREYAADALEEDVHIGFFSGDADASQITIVGERSSAGWRWYAQGHEVLAPTMGVGGLLPIFTAGPDQNETVIELVDCRYG